MPTPDPAPDVLFATPSEIKASEWTTALCAAGFDYGLEYGPTGWVFHLPAEAAEAAIAELNAYEADNQNWPPVAAPEPVVASPTPASWSPVWVAGLLIAFFAWLGPYTDQNPFLRAAAVDAEGMRAGEWWRAFTALLVHGDVPHLMGNVCCLLLLGRAACASFGSGLAWTLILGAGVLGNAIEAFYFPSIRLTVGASTAGFGALGLLTGFRAVQKARRWNYASPALREFALPVIAGLSMLAILGTGPRSDLVAHALGMFNGACFGAILGGLGVPRLPPWAHRVLELACISALMLAWRAASAAGAQ